MKISNKINGMENAEAYSSEKWETGKLFEVNLKLCVIRVSDCKCVCGSLNDYLI